MAQPSQEPKPPLTTAQITGWVLQATIKRLELHIQAAHPSDNLARAQAFAEMAELCKDAIETVRVMNAYLRERSEALRERAVSLRARSNELLDRSTILTESQLLHIFTEDQVRHPRQSRWLDE